jgi:hypothetical protein
VSLGVETSMKTYIRLLLAALVAASIQKVSAQSAVAVGTNGVYGYAYGSGSQRAVVLRALRAHRLSTSHRAAQICGCSGGELPASTGAVPQ